MSAGARPFLISSSRDGLDSTVLGSDGLPAVSGAPSARVVERLLRCMDQLDTVPGVVILDVAADAGAADIAAALRANDRLRRTPLVALATERDQERVGELYDAGVNSVVPRPRSERELRELIGRVRAYWLEANHIAGA
jgi:PleD family two-component response regulator